MRQDCSSQQEPLQNFCVSWGLCKALSENSPGLAMEKEQLLEKLMRQFPRLCIRHFQCLFPPNQLAFWLWITPICISQKSGCTVLNFGSSLLSPLLLLSMPVPQRDGDFFTSNLLKMFQRDAHISRQKGHPSSKASSPVGTVNQKLCRFFWAAQGWVLVYWPWAGIPYFGDQHFRLTWALDLITPSLWY